MVKVKLIFLIFIYLIIIQTGSTNTDPLQYFLTDLRSLEAKFVQILINENGDELERTEGVLYLQTPDSFFWHYQKPYAQKIISNGSKLWIFDEDLEQVTVKNIDNKIEQTPAGIILGNHSIKEHFVQISIGVIDGYDWIELTPRDLDAQYKNIKIGFNNNNLGMMIIIDNLEQITRIDFSDSKKNIKLSSEIFNFNVPDNIDIFDETK
jgi:outer membrane lipoprotein carrier protein